MTDSIAVTRSAEQTLQINRTVRQTYQLLAMTMAVGAVGAGIGLTMNIGWNMGMWILFMVVFIGGPFLIHRQRESQASIGLCLAWAGLVGFLFSPMLAAYLSMPGGSAIVMNALTATAALFGGLSLYALSSKRDFSFMGGFLFAGLLVVLLAIVANIFLQIPMLSLVISAAAVLLMSGLILFDTSRMINGGETNPVMITVSLFANLVVMFSHLLNLFTALSGDD